ncbi:hypothetical protein BB561_001154 [Smittium simulii]|uniref:non-specific serine/threonine protein kinase n=1 Tax=Smittium simulii TaxID=133385 RepID=A0A2T9YVV7_9FUNG|nr:hypothetical protein BB561_001154 [Smittium simulii]
MSMPGSLDYELNQFNHKSQLESDSYFQKNSIYTLSKQNYISNSNKTKIQITDQKMDSNHFNASGPDLPHSEISGRFYNYWGTKSKFLGLPSELSEFQKSKEPPQPFLGSLTQRNVILLTLDPQIRRKIEAVHVYFLDYYYNHLFYISNRKSRFNQLKKNIISHCLTKPQLEQVWRNYCINESATLRKRRIRTREQEFDILTQIGQGGYGKVFLVRKRDTGEVCALKKMSKKLLFKLNEVQHILTERDILRTGNSVWLVKLLYAFQDTSNVFLAMEYVPGGDVRTLLNSNGILLNKYIKFYSAEMFVSVAALHTLGFVHRDLKPENFMIDGSGHIKLTDFGLSQGQLSRERLKSMKDKLEKLKVADAGYYADTEKRSFYRYWRKDEMPRAYSIVGSPDYMAPEILYTSLHISSNNITLGEARAKHPTVESSLIFLNQNTSNAATDSKVKEIGYDHGVDYWSLGCILYEFAAGYAPFTGQNNDDVWRNVYHWERTFSKPDFDTIEAEENLTPEMWDIITKLICSRSDRITSLIEAQAQPFFADYDMVRMRDNASPPFSPELESEIDTAYFDDFSSTQNLDLYREVFKKQVEVDGLIHDPDNPEAGYTSNEDEFLQQNSAFAGFTFRHNNSCN